MAFVHFNNILRVKINFHSSYFPLRGQMDQQEPITRSFHLSCTLESTLSRIFLFLELRYLRGFFNLSALSAIIEIISCGLQVTQ